MTPVPILAERPMTGAHTLVGAALLGLARTGRLVAPRPAPRPAPATPMPPAPDRPPTARAVPRADPRWWGWVAAPAPGQLPPRLVCPRGHPFRRVVRVTAAACLRCEHAPPPGPPATHACGCWVYVARRAGGGWLLTAVDHGELDAVEACDGPAAVFARLGLGHLWPP